MVSEDFETIYIDGFPPQLPKKLVSKMHIKGNLNNNLFEKCIAIVGSRNMTNYGKRILERVIPDLVSSGITIISGFMYGIDKTAHEITLANKGSTVAVMPCGINIICPSSQKDLYKKIVDTGLVVSQFESKFKPRRWTFAKRNSLIAGLSHGVVIVEASESSGSLITAREAFKQEKPVFCFPGSVFNTNSYGTNTLIKNGSHLVTNASDILRIAFASQKEQLNLGLEYSEYVNTKKLNDDQALILKFLNEKPLMLNDIVSKIERSHSSVISNTSELLLMGFIKEVGGYYYAC